MHRLLLYSCLVLCLMSCTKGSGTKKILIKGRLLQSSSNPVPVANYKLSFYQAGAANIPFPITSSSSTLDFTTDAEGYFNCYFPLGKGMFVFIPTSNTNPLNISGAKNNGIQINWGGLPANDTDLVDTYLYKKIHEAIVQIDPQADITANDTLYITAFTLTGNYTKTVTGLSIPQNTTATVDTITDVIFTKYSFQERMYQNDMVVAKNRSGTFFTNSLEITGDEDEKVFVLR